MSALTARAAESSVVSHAIYTAVDAIAVALQSTALRAQLVAFDIASQVGGRPALLEAYRLAGALGAQLDLWQLELVAEGELEVRTARERGSMVTALGRAIALVGDELERLCKDIKHAAGPS